MRLVLKDSAVLQLPEVKTEIWFENLALSDGLLVIAECTTNNSVRSISLIISREDKEKLKEFLK